MQRRPARMVLFLVLALCWTLVLAACDTAPVVPTAPPSPTVVPTAPPSPTVVPTAVPTPPVAPTVLPAPPTPAVAAPRTLTVLAGAGQDTNVVIAYFPETVRVRAGDTVIWKHNMEEVMTVNFLGKEPPPAFNIPVPGSTTGDRMRNPKVFFATRAQGAPLETYDGTSYIGSGILSRQPFAGSPPNETFSVRFDKPGLYRYTNIVAPVASGTVEVLPATATEVPEQAQLDVQARAEMAALLAPYDAIKDQGKQAHSEPAANNSNILFVRAGSVDFRTGDQRSQLFEFLPKELTIKAGDTVVWGSNFIHTVTFQPQPPPYELLLPTPQPPGSPVLVLNPKVFVPAKSGAIYDPAKYYNSAPIGLLTPNGNNWSLAFDAPGTYEYFCALHRELGMKGIIIVQPR